MENRKSHTPVALRKQIGGSIDTSELDREYDRWHNVCCESAFQ